MSYVGGKHRMRKDLVRLIARECQALDTRTVWEPFCGGLNVTAELGRHGFTVHASDFSKPAVVLYQAARLGWEPPESMTLGQWEALKKASKDGLEHPLISYAGFCKSFNSVYFSSYAPDKRGWSGVKNRVRACRFASLKHASYSAVHPPSRSVVYCDPPYADTDAGAYRSLAPEDRAFDHASFWNWCRAQRDRGSTVLVSEYTAPEDAALLWHHPMEVNTSLHTGETAATTERVFIYRGTP